MPEEKQENKKPGILKRIFKWFGLAILTLLLIAAFFFQAPWKVITLLVIILLACTALPKPARKWFWLSVGLVVIALIIWIFLPDGDRGDWRPYTFDEELAAIEAARAIPDSENAAIIYNQLLQDYNEDDFEPNLPDPNTYYLTRSEPWLSKDYPEMAEWLKGQESTIATLMEASKKEQCRFPINANPISFGQTMNRLSPMRRWSYLLIIAGNNDIAEDRTDQALEKCIALLQMAKHQYQQPTMIDTLVGIAIEALAIKQFNRFVVTANPTEEHLTLMEEALSEIKHDWASDLPMILECEKLMSKNTVCYLAYEVNPKGRTRLNRNALASILTERELKEMGIKESDLYWQTKLMRAHTIIGWFYMPSTPQRVGEIIDASYKRFYAMAEPDFDWQKEPKEAKEFSLISAKINFRYIIETLAPIMEPAYHSVHDIYLRVIADKRGSHLLIALRRYKNQNGFWPVNLDDVKSMAREEIFVDPTNGGDFVYEITEENFRLYSKGKNGIDEDGERDEIAGADDRLIWPRKTRKTKKENTNAE